MTTTCYLRSDASSLGGSGQDLASLVEPGNGSTSAITNTTSSGTNIQVTATGGGTALTWFTEPLSAVTISGSVTVNVRGKEAAIANNAGAGILVQRCGNTGTVISAVLNDVTIPTSITEYSTSDAAKNGSFTPTSTTLANGDRLKFTLKVRNVGTMGAGTPGVTNTYAGRAAGAAGDTFVTFTEQLSPATAANPTVATISATTTGSTTAVTAPVPPGVTGQANSMIVVAVLTSSGSSSITGLGTSGLTHVAGSPIVNTNTTLNVLSKAVSGTESGTYALTASAGIAFWASGSCRVDNAASWDTNSGTGSAVNSSSSANSLTTSMTTQAANELLMNFAAQFNGALWTQPSGFIRDFTDTAGPGTSYFADKPQAAAGATGTLTTAVSGSASQMAVWTGAIVPPSTGTNAPAADAAATADGETASIAGTVTPADADATAAGQQPAASIAPTMVDADAVAAGQTAAIAATTNTTDGDATAAGFDATVTTGGSGTNAPAADADATADGQTASIAATVTPADADAVAAAQAPTADVKVNAADADAVAAGQTPAVDIKTNAADADATAAAFDATVSTASFTNAPAGDADATADGQTAAIAATTTPAQSAATAAGQSAQASIGPAPTGGAATATAGDAVINLAVGCDVATTIAAALDATVITGVPGAAHADCAFATAAAFDARICIETPRPNTGVTARPSSGTTVYALATTSRPNSGVTARPDTGETEGPC